MNIHSNYNVLKINELDFLHAFACDRPSPIYYMSNVRHLFASFWETFFFPIVFLVHGKSIRFTPATVYVERKLK